MGGPKGKEWRTIETEEKGAESMSGGMMVPVAIIKATSERKREDEHNREASWSTEETPWRWLARA